MFLQHLSNYNISILDNKNPKSSELIKQTELSLKETEILFNNLFNSYGNLNQHLKQIEDEIDEVLLLLKEDEQSLLKDSFANQDSLIYELGKAIEKTHGFLRKHENEPLLVNFGLNFSSFNSKTTDLDKKITLTVLDNLICHSFLYHKKNDKYDILADCLLGKIKHFLMEKLNLTFINQYHYFAYSKIDFNDDVNSKNGFYYFKPTVFNGLLADVSFKSQSEPKHDLHFDLTKNKKEDFYFFFKQGKDFNDFSAQAKKQIDEFFHHLFFTHKVGENKLSIIHDTVKLANDIKVKLNKLSEDYLNIVHHEVEVNTMKDLYLYLDHFLEIRKIKFKIDDEETVFSDFLKKIK